MLRFGDSVQDPRVGDIVVISKPLFSEPFLTVTFEYMSLELLQKKGIIPVTPEITPPPSREKAKNKQMVPMADRC